MRTNRKLLTFALCLGLLESTAAFSATTSSKNDADLSATLSKITAQTEALQAEIQALKAELNSVKKQKTQAKAVAPIHKAHGSVHRGIVKPPLHVAGPNVETTAAGVTPTGYEPGDLLTPEVALNYNGQPFLTMDQKIDQAKDSEIHYLIGNSVVTSQVLNINSAYDASDLIVNLSTMNEDLRFLRQRQQLEKLVGTNDLPSSKRPLIFLSGKVEGQASYFEPFGEGTNLTSTALDLSAAEFDVLAEASPWAYGFLSLAYDGSSFKTPLTIGAGNPINNSRIYLKRGFVTIGNLDKSPFYLSMGQEYVPFGRYSSYLLTNPDTLTLGRTNARAAVLGFYKNGLYLSAYGLNGSVNTAEGFDSNHLYEWGTNGGYRFSFGDDGLKGEFGAGYINNIAESQGFQNTGLGTGSFQGFAANSTTETLQHPVGGFDAHFAATWGPLSTYNEFITATQEFSPLDLTYNDSGAQPSALHVEGAYTFSNVFNSKKDVALYVAYDRSWQALAINLPKNSYTVGLSTSLWKNTTQTIEYRHDVNYASTDTASGLCDPTNSGVASICPVTVAGPTQNQILGQIGVYF